jgi:hypothetical protein
LAATEKASASLAEEEQEEATAMLGAGEGFLARAEVGEEEAVALSGKEKASDEEHLDALAGRETSSSVLAVLVEEWVEALPFLKFLAAEALPFLKFLATRERERDAGEPGRAQRHTRRRRARSRLPPGREEQSLRRRLTISGHSSWSMAAPGGGCRLLALCRTPCGRGAEKW